MTVSCSLDDKPLTDDQTSLSKSDFPDLAKSSNYGMEVLSEPFDKKIYRHNLILSNLPSSLVNVDFNQGTLHEYNWTHFRFYEFPISNSNKSLGVYQVQNSLHYFLWSMNSENYTTYDLNGKVTSVTNLSKGRIVGSSDFGFIFNVNESFANMTTNSICDCHGEDSLCNHKYDKMENCHQYDYNECQVCAEDVCDQDSRCVDARTWTGPAWVVGKKLACLI